MAMNWFRDLKIGRKLLSAFLMVVSITLVLGAVASIRLSQIKDKESEMSVDYLPGVLFMGEISDASARYRRDMLYLALTDDIAEKSKFLESTDATKAELNAAMARYEGVATDPADRANLSELRAAETAVFSSYDDVRRLAREPGHERELRALLNSDRLKEPVKVARASISKMVDWNTKIAQDAIAQSLDA